MDGSAPRRCPTPEALMVAPTGRLWLRRNHWRLACAAEWSACAAEWSACAAEWSACAAWSALLHSLPWQRGQHSHSGQQPALSSCYVLSELSV